MVQSCFEHQGCYYVLVYDQDNFDCSVVQVFDNGYFCSSLNCYSDKELEVIEKSIKNGKLDLREKTTI